MTWGWRACRLCEDIQTGKQKHIGVDICYRLSQMEESKSDKFLDCISHCLKPQDTSITISVLVSHIPTCLLQMCLLPCNPASQLISLTASPGCFATEIQAQRSKKRCLISSLPHCSPSCTNNSCPANRKTGLWTVSPAQYARSERAVMQVAFMRTFDLEL